MNNFTLKGLIFDMDGTLTNNLHFHQEAWLHFLKTYGQTVTEAEFQQKNVGLITEIIPRFFPDLKDAAEIERLGKEKEAVYRSIAGQRIQPLPGLIHFLRQARHAGYATALATAADSDNITFTIHELGLAGCFDALTGSEEVKRGKPDPEVYTLSCKKLGLEARDCIAFEDTQSGIRAALAAGLRVIGMATTHSREELSAFPLLSIIRHYEELPPELLQYPAA